MKKRNTDIQCEKILNGLKTLIDQLKEPLAQSVLDFENNAKTNNYYDFLIKLKRSLTQYAEKGGNLLYVGFVGHYSAGKSSTINSILEIWDKKGSRNVGLNPTDKSITLLTDKNNSSYLIGIIREGAVSIRTEFYNIPLLQNLVIADTPGTGDPHLIEEMARDFLPICDLIIFFLSAANPLDKTDIPLLLEVHNQLPFIPIKFVITRADEFIINKKEELNVDNFDELNSEIFLSELIGRLNKLATDFDFSNDDFIMIDNIEKYNIGSLKEFLLKSSNKDNMDTYVSMHANKLSFFISNADEAKNFFREHIDANLTELSRIVSNSEKMIEEYHDKVQITNNKLTTIWADKHSELKRIKEREIIFSRDDDVLPNSLNNLTRFRDGHFKLKKKIKDETKSKSQDIVDFIVIYIKERLRNYFNEIRKAKEVAELSELRIEDLDKIEFKKDSMVIDQLNINPPINLVTSLENFQKSFHDHLCDIKENIIDKCKKVESKLRKKTPLKECKDIIQEAAETLSDDVEPYFANVVIYRTSVFSHKVKESIEKLGIGAKLDSLDFDFTDDEKSAIKNLTQEQIFPKFQEIIIKYEGELRSLSDNYSTLLDKALRLRLNSPNEFHDNYESKYNSKQKEFVDEVIQKSQRELTKTRDLIIDDLNRSSASQTASYNDELNILKRKQTNKYSIIIAVIAFVVFAVGFLGANYFGPIDLQNMPVDTQNIWWNIGVGIFCSVVANIISIPIVKKKDEYPKKIADLESKYKRYSWSSSQSLIDAKLEEYKFPQETSIYIESYLDELWMQLIKGKDKNYSFKFAYESYDKIIELDIEYNELLKRYQNIVEDMCPHFIEYFSDLDSNLEKLKKISDKVKKEAIEPSFSLLAETKNKLVDVHNQVSSIKFA